MLWSTLIATGIPQVDMVLVFSIDKHEHSKLAVA
jgi:hypothetical protein